VVCLEEAKEKILERKVLVKVTLAFKIIHIVIKGYFLKPGIDSEYIDHACNQKS